MITAWTIALLAYVVVPITLQSCGGDEQSQQSEPVRTTMEIADRFDMSSIPCGELIGGSKPHLIIQTHGGEMLDVIVPDWVWDSFQNRGGELIGNCSDDEKSTSEETTEGTTEEITE